MKELIKFSKETLDKSEIFAGSVNTSFYAKRNQFDPEKRKLDAKIGKLGEFAVYEYLKDKVQNLTEPDCKIYKPKEKSWDYDLKAVDKNFHVKCQNVVQGLKYGESWIFQKEDQHIFKNYKPEDYVAFVSVDLSKNEAYIKSILSVAFLHNNNLFKKPKLSYLDNKAAVYFEDIKYFKKEL